MRELVKDHAEGPLDDVGVGRHGGARHRGARGVEVGVAEEAGFAYKDLTAVVDGAGPHRHLAQGGVPHADREHQGVAANRMAGEPQTTLRHFEEVVTQPGVVLDLVQDEACRGVGRGTTSSIVISSGVG